MIFSEPPPVGEGPRGGGGGPCGIWGACEAPFTVKKRPLLDENASIAFLYRTAVKQRGQERKGAPPEIIQKFRLRKSPMSSADSPMTLWKEQSTFRMRFF